MKHTWTGPLLLLLTAAIWGSAFVAQRSGMEAVGPFTFLAARSVLTALALLPLTIPALGRSGKQARRKTLLGGLACGGCLFLGSALQQYGLVTVTAGKAGFLTALYIVFVPVLRRLGGRKAPASVWVSVALAAAGLYFLCAAGEGYSFQAGDVLLLGCALGFSLHILVVDRTVSSVQPVALSGVQFLVCAGLSLLAAAVFETPKLSSLKAAWLPIAYAGLLSGAVGYTLQIVAQKRTDPAVASLLMSLESVFSALAGWAVLGERLSAFELFGCGLVFAAVLLAQLPEMRRAQKA